MRMIFFSLRFLRCEPTILSYLIWFEQKEAVAVPSAATECHRHHWPLPTIRPKCPGLYACAPHLESSRASGAPLLSGRGLQLQLDDERELLRAALRHLEPQLLEAAHLRKEARQHVSKQVGTPNGVRGLGCAFLCLPACLPAYLPPYLPACPWLPACLPVCLSI